MAVLLGTSVFVLLLAGCTSIDHSKVKVSVYYETYCRASVGFIVGELKSVMDEESMTKNMDLSLVPFGNAGYDPRTKKYTCQHGPQECEINLVQGCIIKKGGGDQLQTFNAVYLEEEAILKHNTSDWIIESISGLPSRAEVLACIGSPESLGIVAEFAKETEDLQPPHRYTPWVTIDGTPLKGDFKSALCASLVKRGKGCPSTP